MRLADWIIRAIDLFYLRPVAAVVPRQVFRYAVCGGSNVVFGWGCYFLIYNFLIDKQLVDLGFVAVSAHVAAMLVTFPLTFFAGFWLNRYVAFRRSPIPSGTQLFRYLLSRRGIGRGELCLSEILCRILRHLGHPLADARHLHHHRLQFLRCEVFHLPGTPNPSEHPTVRSCRTDVSPSSARRDRGV